MILPLSRLGYHSIVKRNRHRTFNQREKNAAKTFVHISPSKSELRSFSKDRNTDTESM